VIEMDTDTKKRVDAMWAKLGLGPGERAERFKQNEPR
jgi:hypothetical protein